MKIRRVAYGCAGAMRLAQGAMRLARGVVRGALWLSDRVFVRAT